MGLDLWFREDVARILAATHEAMANTGSVVAENSETASCEQLVTYQRGYEDALRAVGVAFGVMLPRGAAARSESWRALDAGSYRGLT